MAAIRHRHAYSALAFAVALLASSARAQTAADVAMLTGPDRMERIVAGAKKEGGLMLYSSATVDDMAGIIASFEKKYGLKVRVWRGSSEDIRQRAVTESIFTTLFNTNLIKKADAPKTYEDLVDPKWKGKLAVEAEDANWLMGVASVMGEQKSLDLFRRIVAANGISIRKGHTLLANLVVSGETPMALTVYGYKANQLVHSGAPVQDVLLPPVVALPTGVAVARKAPDPYSAVLFWEHFLTDGQKVLLEQDNQPVNVKVKAPPPGIVITDPQKLLDEGDKWVKLYRDIFAPKAR